MLVAAASLLALSVSGPPCEGNVGSVGDEAVPCQVARQTTTDSACTEAARALREVAVRHVLRAAGAWPDGDALERRLDEYLPSKAAFLADRDTQRKRTTDLNQALSESEADPTRDNEIWKTLVSSYMPYKAWLSFRSQMTGKRLADAPREVSTAESDDAYRRARASVVPLVIETAFQEWVRTAWAPANGIATAAQWTPELQDRFWAVFIEKTPMTRNDRLRCAPIAPSDLRTPRVRRPTATETSATATSSH